MKKIIISGLIVLILAIAYATKPDDKTCILETVKIVWGKSMANPNRPEYFEEFMNLTSKSVIIDDFIFLKRMKYVFATDTKTVTYGAFNKVMRAK